MLNTFKKADTETLVAIHVEMDVRKTKEVFLLFAMGSQFDHLIYQLVSKMGIFVLVADPVSVSADDVKKVKPKGIIISGGPASAYDSDLKFDRAILDLGIPVLGICLGFQIWADYIGAKVTPASKKEFGVHNLNLQKVRGASVLFKSVDLNKPTPVLESHGDAIYPSYRLEILASTENAPVAAARYRHLWGVQFHPEVTETECGHLIFENFCSAICYARDRFPAQEVTRVKINEVRRKIGAKKKVLLAISGGSDSSVVAELLRKAVEDEPGRIHAVYIKGIDRPDDELFVRKYFGDQEWLELEIIDATDKFLEALKGKISMREKRVAMRGIYKEILERRAKAIGADFIAQGTLYTDISESGGGHESGARKAVIKVHHNIGLGFSVEELNPLADCVKDGAREIGRVLGVPEDLLVRHPFPGPGLVVRIEGEVTADKLRIARHADEIYIEELRKHDLYNSVWQAGVTLTGSVVTCTKGDDAASGMVARVWAVWSVNGFTARAARLPWEFMETVAQRLTNEIREIGSVDYRISGKPPATIECG